MGDPSSLARAGGNACCSLKGRGREMRERKEVQTVSLDMPVNFLLKAGIFTSGISM